jgi:hypothetical protein
VGAGIGTLGDRGHAARPEVGAQVDIGERLRRRDGGAQDERKCERRAGGMPPGRSHGGSWHQGWRAVVAGRMRMAWPPPGARTTRSWVALVIGRRVIVTGSGLSNQFAPGPSA